jgi:hypothetical protein
MKFYISFTVTKILLLERLKELIGDLISVLMDSGFQPTNAISNSRRWAMAQIFFLVFPAIRMGRKGKG